MSDVVGSAKAREVADLTEQIQTAYEITGDDLLGDALTVVQVQATEIASLRAALHDSQQGEECGKAVIADLRAELAKVEGERDAAKEWSRLRGLDMITLSQQVGAAEARALAAEARMGEVVKAAQSLMDEMRAHVDANDETAMILPRAQFNRYVGSVARIRSALAKEPAHDH